MIAKVRLRTSSGVTITSRKSADRYVRRGRARRITDQVYELIEDDTDHRHVSVCDSVKKKLCYDDGLASVDAVKHLPTAGDPLRLFMGPRQKTQPREDRVVLLSVTRKDCSVEPSVVPSWPLPIPRFAQFPGGR